MSQDNLNFVGLGLDGSMEDILRQMKKQTRRREQRLYVLQTVISHPGMSPTEVGHLQRFLCEADEVAEWMSDQQVLADSKDYGTDVENVELLMAVFDTFMAGLRASAQQVNSVIISGQILMDLQNPGRELIAAAVIKTAQIWEDLKELAQVRQNALASAKQVHVFDRTAAQTIARIQEKLAALAAESYGQDLETIQALIRKHQGFESDVAAVKEQVEFVSKEARRLAELFPDARDHIEVKYEKTAKAWAELNARADEHKLGLHEAEKMQSYFEQYSELMAWITDMIGQVTVPELAQDVRSEGFDKFYRTGDSLIAKKHFMSNEVAEKIRVLREREKVLYETWEKRRHAYDQNLDVRVWKRDAELQENCLASREAVFHDGEVKDTVAHIEDLIHKHDGFEKTIDAQADKFNASKRIKLVEEEFIRTDSSSDNIEPTLKKTKNDDVKDDGKETKMDKKQSDIGKEAVIETEVRAARERAIVPLDVRIKSFRDMLVEKDVSAFSTWEKELHKIVFDPRYLLLTSKERKQVFEKYVKEWAEKKQKKMRELKVDFRRLMEEAALHGKSSFSNFVQKHGEDDCFKNVKKMRERESLVNEYILNVWKREEEKVVRMEQIRKDFVSMFVRTDLPRKTMWPSGIG